MTKKDYVWLSIFVAGVIGAYVIGSSVENPPTNDQESIKFGFIGPLSGELASWGNNQKSGVELALNEVNNQGGIGGRRIEVVYEDSQCKPKLSVNAVNKLIETDGVLGIIGDSCSSAVLAIAPIAEGHQRVLIATIPTSNAISESGDYVFRNFLTNNQYAKQASKVLKERFQATKVAVLYANDAHGKDQAESFKKNYQGSIVLSEQYESGQKEFKTILTKLQNVGHDVVYLSGYYPEGAQILKQSRELGLNTQFLGGDDSYDDPGLIALAGKQSAEGFMFLSVTVGAGPKSEEFAARYRERYSKDPPVYSDYAFDTFNILAGAVKRAMSEHNELTSSNVKDALYKTDYAGASNRVKFDKNGDLEDPRTVVKVVRDGKIGIDK